MHDLDTRAEQDVGFTEVEVAGGYKWVEGDGPTIAVPGELSTAISLGVESGVCS